MSRLQVDADRERQLVVLNDVIAFTGAGFQALTIENLDTAAAVLDETLLLQDLRQQRDRGPSDPQHLGEKLLGERYRFAVGAVRTLQQPSA